MTSRSMPRVLVVDDNEQLRVVLKELLAREGCEVEVAANGAEAMANLVAPGTLPPDAVILDVTMPLEGGIEVLRLIRTGLRELIPVIVLTASATEEQEDEMRSLGIDAYLRKPVSSELLVSTLRRVLRRGWSRSAL